MSHEGKTQITFIFTASGDQVVEGDRLFASHAGWMKESHHQKGELALLRYNVSRGPELSNSLDPSSAPTGRTCFALTEVYESPAGLADHWRMAPEGWEDFQAFVAWASDIDVCVLHEGLVAYSLW